MNELELHHFVENRPWGNFEQFTLNQVSTVKIITVTPGESLSLQKHSKRKEFWKVISGNGTISIDGIETPAVAGSIYTVPLQGTHRVSAGTNTLVFLEIALGEFDENDIVRLEDKYGRS